MELNLENNQVPLTLLNQLGGLNKNGNANNPENIVDYCIKKKILLLFVSHIFNMAGRKERLLIPLYRGLIIVMKGVVDLFHIFLRNLYIS
ncbi:hypothetical protein LCGC14_1683630 [marine sediment metagenome]|uniref:Uncharacterized protein n=1 Tax=marine sediment metagenome TaxID=412755 RepID=A0A0F9KMX1_9ZZZZ